MYTLPSIFSSTLLLAVAVLAFIIPRVSALSIDSIVWNNSSYNETCGGRNNKRCDTSTSLICSPSDKGEEGLCVCGSGTVYVLQEETCWDIPTENHNNCAFDIQCHSGHWGHHSRCNKRTGQCECYDYHHPKGRREMVLMDGICSPKKPFNSSCEIDESCQRILGQLSRCVGGDDYKLGNCECMNGTAYHEISHQCFLRKRINDTCSENEECEASLGLTAKCGYVDTSSTNKICHLWPGDTPRFLQGMSVVGWIFVIIGAVIVCVLACYGLVCAFACIVGLIMANNPMNK